ncbi:hypothetical protein GINT2_000919 [Glugoides intestinalis]
MKQKCINSHFCAHDQDIRKISIVSIFICIFLVFEIWGHIKTKSLSLLADALHLVVDLSGFAVSIITLRLSKKKPDQKMTFGYERTETIGALFSVFLILAAVLYLFAESIHKYMHPNEIDGKTFLLVAAAGLIINIICMLILHTKSHKHTGKKENLSMRATYIHVVGDIIQSVGVLFASAIIYFFPEAIIADILCTIFFAFLVILSTFNVIKDAVAILSERAPSEINIEEIKQKVLAMDRVIKITDLKVWSISTNKTSISMKILSDHIKIKDYERLLVLVNEYLVNEKKIDFVNVQIDTPLTVNDDTEFNVQGISIKNMV